MVVTRLEMHKVWFCTVHHSLLTDEDSSFPCEFAQMAIDLDDPELGEYGDCKMVRATLTYHKEGGS